MLNTHNWYILFYLHVLDLVQLRYRFLNYVYFSPRPTFGHRRESTYVEQEWLLKVVFFSTVQQSYPTLSLLLVDSLVFNRALGKLTSQSTTDQGGLSKKAVDGRTNGIYFAG